jgi:hypothetical protein
MRGERKKKRKKKRKKEKKRSLREWLQYLVSLPNTIELCKNMSNNTISDVSVILAHMVNKVFVLAKKYGEQGFVLLLKN